MMRPLAFALAVSALTLVSGAASNAAPLPVSPLAGQTGDSLTIEVQHRFGGRGLDRAGPRAVGPRLVGPRVVGPRLVRPAPVWRPRRAFVVGPGYRVARPWWRPGYAVAAGAALGFIAAGSAIAWAGQPPGPGYCWYYTDPGYRAGFWDVCPP
jgi:hypothetical protein